jgi:mono/diheme cytochrome c family protein
MNRAGQTALAVCGTAIVLAAGVVAYVAVTGLSARPQPGTAEATTARAIRRLAVPRSVRTRQNPVPASAAATAEGRAHFADHCASCHGNDGSGDTEMGRGLFPRPPDLRTTSQELTDGELFYFIEEGVRFTGMPAWSTGTAAGEKGSWDLVHFIRHLPGVSEAELEEMAALNPRSPAQVREEIEAERFLQGGEPPAAPPAGANSEKGDQHVHD